MGGGYDRVKWWKGSWGKIEQYKREGEVVAESAPRGPRIQGTTGVSA